MSSFIGLVAAVCRWVPFLQLRSIQHPLPSHRANFGPSCAKALLATGRRHCQGLVGKAKGREGKKKRRASAVSCAWMPPIEKGGWVLGPVSHKALGRRRHVKWVKRPWITKGTSVLPSSRRAGGLGGLAGLGRFPPRCRLGEWTWQIPALACQAKPFPMRPEVAGARIRDACRTGPQLRFLPSTLCSREEVCCVQ